MGKQPSIQRAHPDRTSGNLKGRKQHQRVGTNARRTFDRITIYLVDWSVTHAGEADLEFTPGSGSSLIASEYSVGLDTGSEPSLTPCSIHAQLHSTRRTVTPATVLQPTFPGRRTPTIGEAITVNATPGTAIGFRIASLPATPIRITQRTIVEIFAHS